MGIADAFDEIVTGDMVTAHKPNPEIYLKATQVLGVNPAETFAIEDSPSGIRAARDAGLYTIAIRTTVDAVTSIRPTPTLSLILCGRLTFTRC